MNHYYRLQYTSQNPAALRKPAIAILPYSAELHHDVICCLHGEAFGSEPWPANWDDVPDFDPNGVFLAQDPASGTYLGFVVSYRRWDTGYISVVAVVPGRRREGAASALIARAVEYLKSQKLSIIQLDVDQNNVPAVKAYQKLGFEIVRAFED